MDARGQRSVRNATEGRKAKHLVVRLALARARLALEAAARHRHDPVLSPGHLGDAAHAEGRDEQVQCVAGHLDALELLLLFVGVEVVCRGVGARTW